MRLTTTLALACILMLLLNWFASGQSMQGHTGPTTMQRSSPSTPELTWDQTQEDGTRIVVIRDHVIQPTTRDSQSGREIRPHSLRYSFLRATSEGNKVSCELLWENHADLTLASASLPRLDVLDTKLEGGSLVVAYNKSDRCWAFWIHLTGPEKGKTSPHGAPGTIPLLTRLAVAPAAKSAKIGFDGRKPYLNVTDLAGTQKKYLLSENEERWEVQN